MLTNMELYGTEFVPKVPKGVCNIRLELLEVHLQKLMSGNFWTWNNRSINQILAAKRHWTKLRDGEVL